MLFPFLGMFQKEVSQVVTIHLIHSLVLILYAVQFMSCTMGALCCIAVSLSRLAQRKRTISHARMEAFGRKTTFFATYQPEVYMPDDLEEEEECGSQGTSSGCPSRQEPAEIDDSLDVQVI